MKKRYTYDNGLPFEAKLLRDIKESKKRIADNFPSACIIVAPPGRGKTTLAVHIAEQYQGSPIIFNEQLGNGFEDFNKKLQICRLKKHLVVIYDEGGDIDKRKFMSDTNFKIRRILQLFRGFKVYLIMCLQDFSGLDDSILNMEVIQTLYYIPRRSKNSGDFWAYGLQRMYWILKNMGLLKKYKDSPSKAFGRVPPNYYGHFLDLPPERAEELQVYSLGAKNLMLDQLNGQERGLYDYKAIAKHTGHKLNTIRTYIQDLNLTGLGQRIKSKKWFNEEEFKKIVSKLEGGS